MNNKTICYLALLMGFVLMTAAGNVDATSGKHIANNRIPNTKSAQGTHRSHYITIAHAAGFSDYPGNSPFYLPLILRNWSAPPSPTPVPQPTSSSGGLIQPTDLTYLGAFRLPTVPDDEHSWMWANWSSALAYDPGGDPANTDAYPGSLFGTGHDWNQWVSEVSIPVPVVSPGKNVAELNTATTLQPFADIRGGLFGDMEMPRVGLAYVPASNMGGSGDAPRGYLYFAWAPHLDENATAPSHGRCELDLSNPQSTGLWHIGDYQNYVTGDYLFDIPQAWAASYVSGRALATGRYRDGGQSAQGPALFAIAPWAEDGPPAPGATLPTTPLILYTAVTDAEQHTLNGYHHVDEWTGGVWLTAENRAAVLFVGTQGTGASWYGCADGTDAPPWPPDCDRGWWATDLVGRFLFYDPADLAAVAQGTLEPWEPQPYATLDIDDVLYHVTSTQQKYHVAAMAFDRRQGLLYVLEPLADESQPLVHVWRVN